MTAIDQIKDISTLCEGYNELEDMPYSDFIKMVGKLDDVVRSVNELRQVMPPVLTADDIATIGNRLYPRWRSKFRNFKDNVLPRHCIYYMMKKYTPLSLREIGKYCNNSQDHTTVLNAIKAVKNGIDTGNVAYIHTLEQLQREINKLLNLN